jgi:hypothetical protein
MSILEHWQSIISRSSLLVLPCLWGKFRSNGQSCARSTMPWSIQFPHALIRCLNIPALFACYVAKFCTCVVDSQSATLWACISDIILDERKNGQLLLAAERSLRSAFEVLIKPKKPWMQSARDIFWRGRDANIHWHA